MELNRLDREVVARALEIARDHYEPIADANAPNDSDEPHPAWMLEKIERLLQRLDLYEDDNPTRN